MCLGNICRSPLAEGIFDRLIAEKGLSGTICTDSAGTAAYHIGANPDSRSVSVAKVHGIRLNHRGRQFSESDFRNFDYILAMDRYNFQDIEMLYTKKDRASLYLMRAFDPKGRGEDVPDPYYGGDQGFEEVYRMLVRSSEELLQTICEEKIGKF